VTNVISVRDLRKAYRIYAHPRDMLIEAISGRARHREYLALDGISFGVAPGMVVGLIGRNGAGKSTLLRIIAGTLDATSGTVSTRGRIAAILELGTGFHPDYTGRENVYLGGLCLGLSRHEIDRQFNHVVTFSELGDFIDQPFRTYSNGMQARLTFSVATCVDPDILIIDEALSVGDARFQLKSFDRIRDFKRRGKAILLVSHNINHIVAFCDQAILLECGRIYAEGDPNKVSQVYHELLFTPTQPAETPVPTNDAVVASEVPGLSGAAELAIEDGIPPVTALGSSSTAVAEDMFATREHRYGNGAAVIEEIKILDSVGRSVRSLRSLERYTLWVTVSANAPLSQWCLGVLLRDHRGLDLFGTDSLLRGTTVPQLASGAELTFRMHFRAALAAGTYYFTIGVAHEDGTKYDMRLDAHEFVVEPTSTIYTASIVNLDARIEVGQPVQSEPVTSGTSV
jgi:lipopolysaccharide transport system ATP-binding protein